MSPFRPTKTYFSRRAEPLRGPGRWPELKFSGSQVDSGDDECHAIASCYHIVDRGPLPGKKSASWSKAIPLSPYINKRSKVCDGHDEPVKSIVNVQLLEPLLH